MNYIRHLNAFFSVVRCDKRLTSSHVSLYMALFQYWNFNRFQNPFPVYRDTMMQLSKIGSKNTYHKCIKELHLASYIVYHPAVSKYQPVKISMIRLDSKLIESKYQQLDMFTLSSPLPSEGDLGEGQRGSPNTDTQHVPNLTPVSQNACPNNGTVYVPNLTDTSTDNGTTQVPKMGHLIKQNLKQNKRVCNTPTKIFNKNQKIQEEINKLAYVPKSVHAKFPRSSEQGIKDDPALKEIEDFFIENDYSIKEAKKFFLYNKSRGWMLSDKFSIRDWQALAHKWMMNVKLPTEPTASPNGEGQVEVQFLYESFLQGKKIFSLIQPEHFDKLNLQLTEQIMEDALQERINQVSGTNNHSLNQLWQAYLSNKPGDELLQKDNSNLMLVAKRLDVLDHFKIQKQNGATSLSC